MAQVEANNISATGSSPAIPPQDVPVGSQETQELPTEGNTNSLGEAAGQENEQPEPLVPKAIVEEADDDVLFIFSAPRSQKQKRRRLESLHVHSGSNQESLPPSSPSFSDAASALEHSTRRGTISMVQGLGCCHIEDNECKQIQMRGSSLPAVPPVIIQQIHDLNLPLIDPMTEPNFAAMQDIPLPDSCLRWWDEPDSAVELDQNSPAGWMEYQNGDTSSSEHSKERNPAGERIDSVDAQISPRTKPAITFNANNTSKDGQADARELARRLNDPIRFQPPSYSSTPMPSWSKNWTACADTGNTPSSRARIPSSTPLSLVRNNVVSSFQHGEQTHHSMQPAHYSQRRPKFSCGAIPGMANQASQPPYHNTGCASMGSTRNDGMTTLVSRPPEVFTSPQQQQATASNQLSGDIRTLSQFPSAEYPRSRQSPSRMDNPNDILRKPSLYKIPRWPSPSLSSAPLNAPTLESLRSTQRLMTPNSSLSTNRQNIDYNNHMSTSHIPQSPQPTSDDRPIRRRGARKHSPNLIVDIAETCQQIFPFALIAERHDVPLQKVFDTFSAIIQLPLLRNADDKRRHGSLGKRRMRDFREAKNAMNEDKRGVKRSTEDLGGVGEKRARAGEERPLLKHALLNNARERDVC